MSSSRTPPISVDRRVRSALDKAMVVLFIVAGGGAIIALKYASASLALRLGVPVALILIYAGLTAMRTRFRLRPDQAGDNCYYLGFVYTLFSLGIALYQIQSRTQSPEFVVEVIRDFGVGLASTIVGIALRVWLNQLREDPADIEEAIQADLVEQGRVLAGQVRAAIVALDDVRQETADKMKNYIFVLEQVAQEHEGRVVQLKDATLKLATSIERLAADLQAAEIPTGKLREAASSTIAELQRATDSIAGVERAGRSLATQFDTAGRVLDGMTRRSEEFAKTAADTNRHLLVLGEAFDGVRHQSADFAAAAMKNTEHIVAAGRALERFAATTDAAGERLRMASESLVMEQEALAETAHSMARSATGAPVRAAPRAARSLEPAHPATPEPQLEKS